MKMVLSEDIVSMTDFARGTRERLRTLQESQRPCVLTHNGKAAAVVLSVEAFEQLAADAEEHRMDQRLRSALAAYHEGELGTEGGVAFARLRRRTARRSVNG
jgi:PHD/YefM family antitoxin component YafN of YafNO toxin-antitoxin module